MGARALSERIITCDACIAEGVAWLAANDRDLARVIPLASPIPLRLRPDGFAALLHAIVGQQVSVASAAAIWARLEQAGMATEAAVKAATDEDLRALGLSRPKVRYAKALAAAGIDYTALRALPTDDVIKVLTKTPGIGLWTAEIYAKCSLGRADVFAGGDLALQEAARLIFGLSTRPSEKDLRVIAQRWSPWRSVAARIMWAYYKHAKQREGIS